MSLTQTDVRAYVRQFSRNAEESDLYSNEEIDRAFLALMDDFVRATKCTFRNDTLAITTAVAAITVFPDNFRPEYALKIWIAGKGRIERTDIGTLVDQQICLPAATGVPTLLAFDSATSADLFPTPDANYTAKLLWTPPFTIAEDETFNVPDEYIRTAVLFGVPSFLQHNEKENQDIAAQKFKLYLNYRDSLSGAGSLGATSSDRAMGDW